MQPGTTVKETCTKCSNCVECLLQNVIFDEWEEYTNTCDQYEFNSIAFECPTHPEIETIEIFGVSQKFCRKCGKEVK